MKVKITGDSNTEYLKDIISDLSLNTVCKEANCPNRMECFNKRTATFMILGKVCSRNCSFCNVTNGKPENIDENEPSNVAKAVSMLKLKHVVITSVTRDDLRDGGSNHFSNVVNEIKNTNPDVTIEVLIPDFKGDISSLLNVIKSRPNVINHNVETVPSLYKGVRPQAIYSRSLKVLSDVKKIDSSILTKSGLMLGLGESFDEIVDVLKDLRNIDCDIVTIGQYLPPSEKHYPLKEYVHPDVFEKLKNIGMEMGFKYIASSPLVRSSYKAQQAIEKSI